MLEWSRTEHRDGAITGRVFRFDLGFDPKSREGGRARPMASVRINPDGTVARGPAILKQAARAALASIEAKRKEIEAREEARAFFDDHISFVVVS
jgi:hypothetical protein